MRKTSPLILLGLLGLAPAAVAGSDPDFGASVRQNILVQTADPDPRYQGTLIEGGVGATNVSAVRRYMTGTIRPPQRPDGRGAVGGGSEQRASGGNNAGTGDRP